MSAELGYWRFALLILVMIAAVNDVRTMRIPNVLPALILAVLTGALILHAAPVSDFRDAAAAGLGALVIGYALFALNLMGAGDGKLYAACAAWFGLGGLLTLSLWISLAGVAVSLAFLAALTLRRRRPSAPGASGLTPREALQTRIPFGVAIAAGVAITMAVSDAGLVHRDVNSSLQQESEIPT